jgi:hypothetical protein
MRVMKRGTRARARGRWLLTLLIAVTSFALFGLGVPAAQADNVGTSTYQHTSLYNYDDGTGCVSIGETTEHTNCPTDTWATAVASSLTHASSLSWSNSIEGWVGIS